MKSLFPSPNRHLTHSPASVVPQDQVGTTWGQQQDVVPQTAGHTMFFSAVGKVEEWGSGLTGDHLSYHEMSL